MKENVKVIHKNVGGGGGAVYGLGMIGALIYFIQNSSTAGDVVFGIVKALLWPGFVIYRLLEYLRM